MSNTLLNKVLLNVIFTLLIKGRNSPKEVQADGNQIGSRQARAESQVSFVSFVNPLSLKLEWQREEVQTFP